MRTPVRTQILQCAEAVPPWHAVDDGHAVPMAVEHLIRDEVLALVNKVTAINVRVLNGEKPVSLRTRSGCCNPARRRR